MYLLIPGYLLAQDYELETDISYYSATILGADGYRAERCVLDLYYPNEVNSFKTVVWFHGGALKFGGKQIADRLKEQGFAIVAPNYRLYPKASTKEIIRDAAAAVAWVFKNIEQYGGHPDSIYISGHSAGGYLTSMIGLDKSWLAEFGIDANKIAGLIPFSGHTITHMTVREEMGITNPRQPYVDKMAPLFHVRPDAPPYLMITGDRELELYGRYEENAYMMRMMIEVGHTQTTLYELQGYGHGMIEPGNPLLVQFVVGKTITGF
jgi:acetyl esterase/lipase